MVASVAAAVLWSRTAFGGSGSGSNRGGSLATWLILGCATAAFLVLEWALVAHDFSIGFVAENGGREVPLYYTITSLWSAMEGSLVLWLLILGAVAVALLLTARRGPSRVDASALAVIALVAAYFFALSLFAANPFQPVVPVPPDGPGPNPLLRSHPLMGIHPPLLYLGFIGLAVPFAYAVAGLLTGEAGNRLAVVMHRWTLVSWTALTAGIGLGAWWSYAVLGWGGYWTWDPVENASILPWFTATALLHSLLGWRRRGTLRAWSIMLALAGFLLALLGTFLTRSGLVTSVHSFTQSTIGPLLLGFLVAMLIGCGGLLIWRADLLRSAESTPALPSRAALLLGNNLLLLTMAFAVLLGTMFPMLAEALGQGPMSVGPPYFNQMIVPLAWAVLVLMAAAPLAPWARADLPGLLRRLMLPTAAAAATVAVLGFTGSHSITALLSFGLAAFAAAATLLRMADLVRRNGRGRQQNPRVGAVLRHRRRLGGLLAHLGVALAAVAITGSSNYVQQAERELAVGDTLQVGEYTARLAGIDRSRSATQMSAAAVVTMRDGDGEVVHRPSLIF